ncbi:MAG: hypothetical protein JJE52_14310 [Acidimicrobiia bacterium]|nr:hypothetical protein [Acidimicrobiia bacterium]
MLNPADDFPVHQTPEPIAHYGAPSRNAYDRYFFNGYTPDGELFFAVAMGLYPNRQVIDASLSVLVDGQQRSLHASGRAPLDRMDTRVGPIRVEVVEPLRTLHIVVDEPERGFRADMRFTARTVAVEEPRFTFRQGTNVTFDYTRMSQWGTWSGELEVDGRTWQIGELDVKGTRDRSWGIRPVGEREAGGAPGALPQFFWLWAPINFDDMCTHFDTNDLADGRPWHRSGAIVPVLNSPRAPVLDAGGVAEPMRDVRWHIDWQPGTRRATRATIDLVPWRGEPEHIDLEPIATFQMLGLGYLSSEWNHGVWHGELEVGDETWTVDDLDPLSHQHLHVQQLVRATWGDRTGLGVLEQLAIGPHEPSGFTGLLDGAP